jgi:dipeptidase D
VKEQHRGSDDGVSLVTEQGPALDAAWSQDGSARALDLVQALPTGVVQMNPDLPGVVETSTSLTVAQSVEGVLTLGSMTRSSSTQALEDAVASIQAIARLAGADVEILRSYGPWQPDLGSELLALARANFLRLFGPAPELIVVHGGLECAVIGERLRGVEMISLGPEIVGPHAPGERVSVPATQRFYRLLGALLDDLSR